MASLLQSHRIIKITKKFFYISIMFYVFRTMQCGFFCPAFSFPARNPFTRNCPWFIASSHFIFKPTITSSLHYVSPEGSYSFIHRHFASGSEIVPFSILISCCQKRSPLNDGSCARTTLTVFSAEADWFAKQYMQLPGSLNEKRVMKSKSPSLSKKLMPEAFKAATPSNFLS